MKRSERAKTGAPAGDEKKRADLDEFLSGPSMGVAYERIQRRIFDVDVEKEFTRLELVLKATPKRASLREYGELVDLLDAADKDAWTARVLVAKAQIAFEAFEADVAVVEAALRAECLKELQRQKNAKERAKAIHEADVRALMAERHPHDVRVNAERRARAKRLIEVLDDLHGRLVKRADHLDTMVRTSRK